MTSEHRKGIISFSITDRGALYSSYMPFVQNGAIFIPTRQSYQLGDVVFLLLKIMDDDHVIPVEGTVVWITFAGAQGNKTQGVGVAFSENDKGETCKCIENHLAETLNNERPTETM